MRVGVIGAGGGLGRLIVSALEGQGCEVVVVEPRPDRVAASGGGMAPLPGGRADGRLAEAFSTLDAVVVAAPLSGPDLHRTAVRAGCHVVDVAVGAEINRGLLTLDEEAISAGRSVIVMAGLAPGLRGLLASHILERFSPAATTAEVALLQSPTGTAGAQGTRDMLDLMTSEDAQYRSRPVQARTGAIHDIRLFDLRSTEPDICGLGTRLEFATGFRGQQMHSLLRGVRLLRHSAPRAYPPFRDAVARRKARSPGHRETTALSAVALDAAGTPVGGRRVTVTSDYAATAAIAAAAALTATGRQTQPGAGHLRRSFTLQHLLQVQLVESVVRADTGDLPAQPPPGGT